jgi:hypothetical protein
MVILDQVQLLAGTPFDLTQAPWFKKQLMVSSI